MEAVSSTANEINNTNNLNEVYLLSSTPTTPTKTSSINLLQQTIISTNPNTDTTNDQKNHTYTQAQS